jgi:cytochrome c
MRWIRAGFFAAVTLGISLLLARVHPFGDAGLLAADRKGEAPLEHSAVSPEVRAILANKCADCHSTQTRLPVYDQVAARMAPMSWLMERDIVKGRKAMNLQLWDTYTVDQKATYAAKMVQKTRAGEMPLFQYRIIHWGSRVSEADVQALSQWAHSASGQDRETPVAQEGLVGNAARGEAVFEKRCIGCHTLTQDREGPRLHGVYGRASGSVPGFTYSAALKKADMVWSDESLERWLQGPEDMVPGTNMDFRVVKAQERADLVRFLRESSGK